MGMQEDPSPLLSPFVNDVGPGSTTNHLPHTCETDTTSITFPSDDQTYKSMVEWIRMM